MTFPKSLFFVPLIASCTWCSCLSAPNAPAGPILIVVLDTKNPGAAIPSDFMGLSFEASLLLPNAEGVHYFRPDNEKLISLFHLFGIKNLRIGGNTSDRDAKQLPSEADFDSLFGFAKAANVKIIYCLRLHKGTPEEAAKTVKYIMDRYAPLVDSFSIGQEPSAYPVAKVDTRPASERMGGAAEKYQYADYRADWKRFADVIIAAVPEVKFCGPSVHNNGDWARRFMADFGRSNHVVLITEHLYPGGAGGRVPTPEIGIDRMLASANAMTNSFPKAYQKLYDSFVPMAVSNGLPFRMEEVNNYFNGGATNVSNTFASALWGLDFLWWWATHDAAGLNFHTGDRVAAGSTLQPSKYTAFFTTTNGYLIRPLGYGIKAFDLGRHGKIVPATISNPNNLNLTAYAVLGDDKNLYLTIINKEHDLGARDANVTVAAGEGYAGGQVIFLTAPDGDVAAKSGVTLGGAEIKHDASWNGEWKPLAMPAIGGRFTFKLSAASAAVVKLERFSIIISGRRRRGLSPSPPPKEERVGERRPFDNETPLPDPLPVRSSRGEGVDPFRKSILRNTLTNK